MRAGFTSIHELLKSTCDNIQKLFERKVQFTSAIFYNKYKNIHVTTSGTAPSNTDISNRFLGLSQTVRPAAPPRPGAVPI